MSQITTFKADTNILPPTVPTQFTTDNASVAIPSLNNLNVFGGTTTANNPNGITTAAIAPNSANLYIELTNRAVGSITTTNATPTTVVTLALGSTPGVFAISGTIAGFIPAVPAGGGYFYQGTIRTDGTTATEIGGQFTSFQEDTAIDTAFVSVTTTGNSAIIEVTGIAATTIDWVGILNYTFAS